jgi:sulfate transport system ATP-binding protein
MSIEVSNISKTFGEFSALRQVSLAVQPGELLALLGPSGSGKTTLLRIIAGLEFADAGSGQIRFHDQDVTSRTATERGVGFVFQHYALFKHMSVFENVAFGLRVRPRSERPNQKQIRERVAELLALVQLETLADRYPNELSGGQRQRVALARALAIQPRVLLLDEPFGALDAKVRKELRRWIRRFHDAVHITSILVTHDQEEALEVADRIVVMNEGQIEQIGPPNEVYHQPANPFVFGFLGRVNVLPGRVRSGQIEVGPATFPAPGHPNITDAPANVYVRPQDIKICHERNGSPSLEASIQRIITAGPLLQVELRRLDDGSSIEVEMTHEQGRQTTLQIGRHVHLQPRNIQVFLDRASAPDSDRMRVPDCSCGV